MGETRHPLRIYLLLTLLALLVVFITQNMAVVTVRFLIWKVELSRALMVLVVFLSGVATGAVVRGIRRAPH